MSKTEYNVKNITWLMDKAGRLDWAANKDGLIAFDGRGLDGYYDVYVASPDGSKRTCLTCDKSGVVPQNHNGNPAWHPSGRYIVFQAENDNHTGRHAAATPGAGTFNDLWLMSSDGQEFHRLTDIGTERGQGVLHPHFSHDGSKLFWSERLGGMSAPSSAGEWALKLADFSLEGRPRLSNIRSFQPGIRKMWHESHGFSPDDTKALLSGDLEEGYTIDTMDIYALDLKTDKLTNLTSNKRTWDEHAHFSPDGEKIIWMSNQGYPRGTMPWNRYMEWLATDLWIMNSDGSEKKKLTHFNEPDHPEYVKGRVVVGDGDWSPDGSKYAVLVNVMRPGNWEEWIVVVAFELK